MSTKTTAEPETKLKLDLKVEIDVDWEIEQDPHLDFYGKYTDTWEEGAIDREKRGDRKNSGEYRYFVSFNHAVFKKGDWAHVKGKARRDVIKQYGSLEKAARAYALQDYQRMEDYNNDKWHMRTVVVTISVGCVRAEASLSGIESDCGEAYEKQVALEVAQEATHELKEKIMKRLKVE